YHTASFVLTEPATPEIYTLSLHALFRSRRGVRVARGRPAAGPHLQRPLAPGRSGVDLCGGRRLHAVVAEHRRPTAAGRRGSAPGLPVLRGGLGRDRLVPPARQHRPGAAATGGVPVRRGCGLDVRDGTGGGIRARPDRRPGGLDRVDPGDLPPDAGRPWHPRGGLT